MGQRRYTGPVAHIKLVYRFESVIRLPDSSDRSTDIKVGLL
jgi:hypothetical protein